MPQDAFTLRYLCEELNLLFMGGKINRITQPNNDEIFFTVYTKSGTKKLFISANPSMPRIGVSDVEKESPLTAPNFCMLLRKHLLSATIDSISLIGFDRIVKIELTPTAEFFDSPKKTIYAELMGRYSNIILTENGRVLGGNRGVNVFDNGVRPLIVGRDYVFPPVGEKKVPSDKSLIEYFDSFSNGIEDKEIVSAVQGLAQSTAKEIINAFNKKGIKYGGKEFFEFFNDFIYNKKKLPCVIMENKDIKDVCVFPYNGSEKNVKFFDSLYLAEEFYFKEKEKNKELSSYKERLNSIVNTAIKKAKKKLSAILSRIKGADNAEENRIMGELIISNIYKIKKGDKKAVLDNYYDNTVMEIPLDENLTPSNNAERYYKKYNKQKRSLEMLNPQREMAENEIKYLESVLDEIEIAETVYEYSKIKEELVLFGLIKENTVNRKNKVVKTTPYREYNVDGFKIKVGRNNKENDNVTFSAKPNDIWLHAKDYHSSHVIIESLNRVIPKKVLLVSAEICAYYSKGRDGGKVEIVYTEKKNVKKPPKSNFGFCTYTDFNSVMVSANINLEFLKTD